MADQQTTPQQSQGYYVVNMSTAPYAAYPTTANTQVPVFPNPVPQQFYVPQVPHVQNIQTPQPQPQYMPSGQQPPQFYVPQPGPVYYYDASTAMPMGFPSTPAETVAPLLVPMAVKDRLYLREYDIKCSQWMEESWELFKQHWLVLVLFTILFLGVQFVPYVGGVLSFMLAPGYFIAASHYARTKQWQNSHLFHGIYLFFPLVVISILYGLLVSIGLFLCILPGLYFMIAYCFSTFIYIELRQENLGIFDAMSVSRHVISKNFWSVTGFVILTMLICLAGALLFGIGFLVSMPVSAMMSSFAFRDIFGFSEKRSADKGLICC